MVAVLAPAIPEAIGLAVELLLLVTFVALLGALGLYKVTVQPFLLTVARFFNVRIGAFGHGTRPLSSVADLVTKVAYGIEHALNAGVLASGKAAAMLWHALAQQARWLGSFLREQALTIERNWQSLLWAFPPAAILWETVKLARSLPKVLHTTRVVTHQTIKVVRTQVQTVTTRVEHTISVGLPRIGRLEREATQLGHRIDALSKRLAAPALLAAVGVALARLGLGWVRCPRVGKVGKQLCGINSNLLDALLADAVLIAGAISVRQLATEVLAVQDQIIAGVQRGVRELHGVKPIGEGGYSGVVDGRT